MNTIVLRPQRVIIENMIEGFADLLDPSKIHFMNTEPLKREMFLVIVIQQKALPLHSEEQIFELLDNL